MHHQQRYVERKRPDIEVQHHRPRRQTRTSRCIQERTVLPSGSSTTTRRGRGITSDQSRATSHPSQIGPHRPKSQHPARSTVSGCRRQTVGQTLIDRRTSVTSQYCPSDRVCTSAPHQRHPWICRPFASLGKLSQLHHINRLSESDRAGARNLSRGATIGTTEAAETATDTATRDTKAE